MEVSMEAVEAPMEAMEASVEAVEASTKNADNAGGPVHPAHVMAHAFWRAGPCRGPSEATTRHLQAETRAGPHVTCAKKSQKNGLQFACAVKNSNNRRGKQIDSMLAICVLLKRHARKNEN